MAALSVRVPRTRRLRRRTAERGHLRGRLRYLNRWLASRAAPASSGGIGDTGAAPAAVTAANATNSFAEAAHGWLDGSGPHIVKGAPDPTGIDGNRPYFLVAIDAGNFSVLRDRGQALGGSGGEEFTDDGATVTRQVGATDWSFYAMMQAGTPPATIQAATDVDTLIYP